MCGTTTSSVTGRSSAGSASAAKQPAPGAADRPSWEPTSGWTSCPGKGRTVRPTDRRALDQRSAASRRSPAPRCATSDHVDRNGRHATTSERWSTTGNWPGAVSSRNEETMAQAITVSAPISGTDRTLSFEAGKLALQADGAVVGRIGDTIVLVAATASRGVREGADFFPLTVDIEERMYAAGKIPGSFFRREGRATDQAILTCRLIDQTLRPSFPEGFRNEVHVVGTIIGADLLNPHDVLAINASSAALMISGIPFEGPIGAVRIAYSTDGSWLPH